MICETNIKPYTYTKESRKIMCSFQLYVRLIWCFVMVLLYIWDAINRFRSLYKLVPITYAVLDSVGNFLLVNINLTNEVQQNIFKSQEYYKVQQIIKKTEHLLKNKLISKHRIIDVIGFCIILVTFLGDILARSYCYKWTLIESIKNNFVIFFLIYKFHFFVFHICKLADSVTIRFRIINQYLKEIDCPNIVLSHKMMLHFMRCYYALCEAVEILNGIYGWQFLLTENMLSLYIVEANYLVYLHVQPNDESISYQLAFSLWCIYFLVSHQSNCKIKLN